MIDGTTTWAELAQLDPVLLHVLERYEVGSASGMHTVEELLRHRSKDPGFVLKLLNLYADHRTFRMADYADHSLAAILEYLQRTHRFYEHRLLPKMDMCIAGIKQNFPDHPFAPLLDAFFRTYRNDLLEHIELEENKLFPYASCLYDGNCTFDYSVKEFKLQHDHHVEDDLGKMLNVVEADFPEIAESLSYRSFRSLLEQFEQDLFIHHLIEERVFVTRVHELELQATQHLYQ